MLCEQDRERNPLWAFTSLKKLKIVGGPYWLDVSPLNSLPLEELTCHEDIARKNAPILRAMQTLKTINGKTAAEFGKEATDEG